MIQMIDINKLHPHLDNPRKNLGDLTELVESIKSQGILQNLTVVPCRVGYCTTCNLYIPAIAKCKEDHDKRNRPPCPEWQSNGEYTVIIGHRRLAAAKLAGLTQVPCAIAENMTLQEQIATMLLENMQRNDLTVYEQASGIQMMMNLGETVHSISEKTGFSETTIRRRTKLLELDREKFKASVERGATLMDYIELEKINDIELRNEVLEHVGTGNFQWKLRNAIEEEKNRKKRQVIIEQLEKFATQIDNGSDLQYVTSYYTSDSDVKIPNDADNVDYFFIVSQYGSISLYKKSNKEKEEADNSEWEEKQKKKREIAEALNEKSKQAYELRYDFIKNVSQTVAKKHIEAIVEALLREIIDSYSYNIDFVEYANIFNIKLKEFDDEEELEDEEIEQIHFNTIKEHIKICPELHFLVITYFMLDGINESYKDWSNEYENNETLNTVYNMLEKLGYKKSDEEQALCDGTHELFQK